MPCRAVASTVTQIAEEYEGRLKVCKLNVDNNPKTASAYQIVSIPTLIIIKNGQKMDQIVGNVPNDFIEEKIRLFLDSKPE